MKGLEAFSTGGIVVMLAIAAGAFVVGAAVSGVDSPAASSVDANADDVQWVNQITVKKNGEEIAQFHNTLTNQGKDYIRDKIVGQPNSSGTAATTKNASYISLGNGSVVDSADKNLSNEIVVGDLSRDNGEVTTYDTAGEFKVVKSFTAGSDVGTVNTTGLNWNSTGPSLISGGEFGTEANILTDDTLTVTHNITISDGGGG